VRKFLLGLKKVQIDLDFRGNNDDNGDRQIGMVAQKKMDELSQAIMSLATIFTPVAQVTLRCGDTRKPRGQILSVCERRLERLKLISEVQ
jgi:hypothetical protein